MALFDNKRIFYAVKAGGFAADGSTTYEVVHGLQSIGINTTFNIEDVFEIGQAETYAQPEELPDVEVTLEKVIDGHPLIYHLATPNATTNSLIGRGSEKAAFAMSIFGDLQEAASGTPNSQVTCSGLYVNSLSYTFPNEGNITESVTLVGNSKVWASGSFTFSGTLFDNTDTPIASPSGLQRRQEVVMGSGSSVTLLPYGFAGIPGITNGGYNEEITPGEYRVHVSEISVNADLARENILELGRKNPYYRFPSIPIEVTTEVTVTTTDGDFIDAKEDTDNTAAQEIKIVLEDGTVFDMGTKNKLTGTSQTGGDTGGGNETVSYSFRNGSSNLTVTQSNDPAGL